MATIATSLVVKDWDFQRTMTEIERRQVPYATAMALNDTAQDILDDVQNRMEIVFDRPTRFTKNAFMVWRANKRTLEAKVMERPSVGAKHYLKVQEAGGARPRTGLERMVDATLAYDGVIMAIVPAQGARLNAYGNWSPGERNQAIKAWRETGYTANATDASKKRNKGRRAAFFVPGQGSSLSPGIWKRTGRGKREKISKVAHFTTSMPNYRERLGFLDGAEEIFDRRFGENWRKAFDRAMETAR